MAVLLVAAGSAAGAGARYVLDQWVQRRQDGVFPWGTWVVNITGSLGLGILLSAARSGGMHDHVALAAGTGFLGAYTTFSTLMWESLRLAEEGALRVAALNVVSSVVAGLLAVIAGVGLGTLL